MASTRLSRSASASLLAVGALPFAVGACLHVDGGHLDEVALLCPFRELTGLPCPLCGSVRAVVLASHGSGDFVSYNAVMVVVLVVLAVAGLAGLLAGRRAPRLPAPRWLVAAGVVLVAVLWSWTIAHRDTIVTG